jgi:putative flippase GtrA
MFKQELVLQVARFALVGGIVTATFMGLNKLLGPRLGKNGAFLAAYPPAVALHFCLNKWWTFGSQGGTTVQEASHYLELTLVAFAIQWIVFQLLTRFTRMRPWLASGAATAAQMVIAFVVMRAWIFAMAPPAR